MNGDPRSDGFPAVESEIDGCPSRRSLNEDAAAQRPYQFQHSYLHASRKTTRRCFLHAQMSKRDCQRVCGVGIRRFG